MRVVIADDEVLLRDGLDRLLTEAGFDVVGKAGTAGELRREVELARPDVAIVDIKMPPTHTDEGLVAAREIRASHPDVGVLVLSHYLESHYAMRLLEQHPGGVGLSRLLRRARPASALDQLTEREREVLALMAEGRSNKGICERLFLGPKTVEGHVRNIFTKLGLGESADDHRRVLAVLSYLRSTPQQA